MSNQAVTSFVVRFQRRSTDYRIKVTHVQKETDVTFERIEDVFQYIEQELEEDRDHGKEYQ